MSSKHLTVSVVAYIDDASAVADFCKSFLNNKTVAAGGIFLVCDEADDDLRAAVSRFDGVSLVETGDARISVCFAAAREKAQGDYINFTLTSTVCGGRAYDCAVGHARGQALIALDARYTTKAGKAVAIYHGERKLNTAVDLFKDTHLINLTLPAYIIRRELALSVSFDDAPDCSAMNIYLLRLLEKEHEFYHSAGRIISPKLREAAFSLYDRPTEKEWYTSAVSGAVIPFLKDAAAKNGGDVPRYLQLAAFYMIYAKYNANFFERDTGTLTRDEAFEFDDVCAAALKYIDDEVIFDHQTTVYTVPRYFKMHAYRAKYGERDSRTNNNLPRHLEVADSRLFLIENGRCFDDFDVGMNDETGEPDYLNTPGLIMLGKTFNQEMTMRVIDYVDGKIEMDMQFVDEYLRYNDYEVVGILKPGTIKDEDEITGEFEVLGLDDTGIYSSLKYFGVTVSRFRTLHLSLDADKLRGKSLVFAIKIDGKYYSLSLKYMRGYTRISAGGIYFWRYDKNRCMSSKWRSIYFENMGGGKAFIYEIRMLLGMMFLPRIASFKDRIYCTALRLAADVTRPYFRKKHIRLAFDKLYKAGDNGEYTFAYCNSLDNGIDNYYIISRDSLDYPRMKEKYGRRILIHDTFRQRLIALNAEMIYATHSTVMRYCGFSIPVQKFFKDKFTPVVMCVAHGLTIQNIAQYQNRLFDDTRLYGLASKYEYKNICNETYGYTDKNLKMTGMARYDGLKNNDKRQILITPTWRRNVVNSGIAFMKKTHNDSFKNTEYYRIYNSLINDERLIECAKRTGYRIIYLLHPAMSAQADDYDKNDFVEIVQATGELNYEKILTESSLMVTDYSGVQYDFAYQRKPIVYYHPETLPPQYAMGVFDLETMGFGPICKKHEPLVDTLCKYMENDCKNTPEYIARADDFFEFDDFDNCKRIFDAAEQFMDNERAHNNNNINRYK